MKNRERNLKWKKRENLNEKIERKDWNEKNREKRLKLTL